MHSTAPKAQPSAPGRRPPGAATDEQVLPPVSRPRRIALVLGATTLLMGLTGIGITAVQHAAVGTPSISAAEAATADAAGLRLPASVPLPSLKKIVAESGTVATEGSGLELEHSAADHRRDARGGERD